MEVFTLSQTYPLTHKATQLVTAEDLPGRPDRVGDPSCPCALGLRRTHAAQRSGGAGLGTRHVLEHLGDRVGPVPLADGLALADSHLRCRKQVWSGMRPPPPLTPPLEEASPGGGRVRDTTQGASHSDRASRPAPRHPAPVLLQGAGPRSRRTGESGLRFHSHS